MSPMWFSGRASELVTRRSYVRLLLGVFRFFSLATCVTESTNDHLSHVTVTCRCIVTAALSRITSFLRSLTLFLATIPWNAAWILLAAWTCWSAMYKLISLAGTLSNIFNCFFMDERNSLILFCSSTSLSCSCCFSLALLCSLSSRLCLNFLWRSMIPHSACLRDLRCIEPR